MYHMLHCKNKNKSDIIPALWVPQYTQASYLAHWEYRSHHNLPPEPAGLLYGWVVQPWLVWAQTPRSQRPPTREKINDSAWKGKGGRGSWSIWVRPDPTHQLAKNSTGTRDNRGWDQQLRTQASWVLCLGKFPEMHLPKVAEHSVNTIDPQA